MKLVFCFNSPPFADFVYPIHNYEKNDEIAHLAFAQTFYNYYFHWVQMDNDGFQFSPSIIKNQKLKQSKAMDIQPWKDQPQALPLSLFSVQSERIPIKSQTTYKIDKMKRSLSDRELHSKSTSLSPRKQWKTSTILPKMNIGNISIKPRVIAIHLNKEVDRKNKRKSVSPSFGCVNRELAIERKLFLMNNNANKGANKRNLREYVQQYAYTIK